MTGQGVPLDADALNAIEARQAHLRAATAADAVRAAECDDCAAALEDVPALVAALRRVSADLAAAVAERDEAVTEATRARFENERLISAIRSEWMRQTDALKAERDEARREAERLDAALNDAVQSMSDLGRDLTVEGERRDAALAQVEAVRALCDECVDSVPRALIRRTLDEGDGLAEVAAVRKSAGDLHSEWMRQIEALKAERDEIEALKAERDEALARVEAVRALCDEADADAQPAAFGVLRTGRVRRALDAGDGQP